MNTNSTENNSVPEAEHAGLFSRLSKAFFSGFIVCLPIALTVVIIVWLIKFIATPARGIIEAFFNNFNLSASRDIPFFETGVTLISALCVVLFFVLIGLISRAFFMKWVLKMVDGIFRKLPMVNSVYSAVKQIIDTFGGSKKQTFSKVALVEFPKADSWTFAFVTNENPTKLCTLTGEKLIHIFVPTTPNPTSGYMVFVPERKLIFLEISVVEAMQAVVSGGAAVPESLLEPAAES